MLNNLRDLYQQVIIDHGKRPHNFCACEHASCTKEGYNPLCGDRFTLYVNVKDDIIESVCFQGQGCAISTASASLMTEAVKGKTVAEFLQLFAAFQKLVTTPPEHEISNDIIEQLGKLAVLSGVREFPVRVKCATLAWHTLKAALTGESNKVTTE